MRSRYRHRHEFFAPCGPPRSRSFPGGARALIMAERRSKSTVNARPAPVSRMYRAYDYIADPTASAARLRKPRRFRFLLARRFEMMRDEMIAQTLERFLRRVGVLQQVEIILSDR